jgi:hypothetical protein
VSSPRSAAVALLGTVLAALGGACTDTTVAPVDGGDTDGPGSFGRCAVTSECRVVARECCGVCGQPTKEDVVAVSRDQERAYRDFVCRGNSACPACASIPNPYLAGICRSGECVVVDLAEDPLTSCTDDSDCKLRTVDCCECGGRTSQDALVAIRVDAEAAFSALVCDVPPPLCAECAPVYPPSARAVCPAATRRCAVAWAL